MILQPIPYERDEAAVSVTLDDLKRDYRKYMDSYALFCKDIGVDLDSTTDREKGFWVDKFINNIEK